MLYGSSAKTHTSMKENEGSLTTRWILDDTTIDEKSEKPTTVSSFSLFLYLKNLTNEK